MLLKRCSQCIVTNGSPLSSKNRNPVYPSTTFSTFGFSRSSMMAWKHFATSSVTGSFLVPAEVFVGSITKIISDNRWSWWSIFTILFPRSIVNTIFEKELPYFKAALLLHKSAILFAHSISFFPLISAIRVAKTKLTQYPLCNFAKICVRGGIGLQGERW